MVSGYAVCPSVLSYSLGCCQRRYDTDGHVMSRRLAAASHAGLMIPMMCAVLQAVLSEGQMSQWDVIC